MAWLLHASSSSASPVAAFMPEPLSDRQRACRRGCRLISRERTAKMGEQSCRVGVKCRFGRTSYCGTAGQVARVSQTAKTFWGLGDAIP